MLINLLHHPKTPLNPTNRFTLFGCLLGLFFYAILLNFYENKTQSNDNPTSKQTVFTKMYYTDSLKIILHSQKINSTLKKQLSDHPTGFFPKKFYITTIDQFEPGLEFPHVSYHSSIAYDVPYSPASNSVATFQIYGVTLHSPEELARLSEKDGIEKIEEWPTIKTIYPTVKLHSIHTKNNL